MTTTVSQSELQALEETVDRVFSRFADGPWAFEDGADELEGPVWAASEELGITLIGLGEEQGGVGGGPDELAVVMRQVGRWLAPGPFLGTALYAAAAGRAGAGWPSLADVSAEGVSIRLVRGGRSANKHFLFGPRTSEHALLVSADRVSLVQATKLGAAEGDRFDPGLRAQRADESLPSVHSLEGEAATEVWLLGRLLVAAYAAGISSRMLEVTVDYAKARHQFGRPIGAFQAVKHRCADMAIREQASRACVEQALAEVGSQSDRAFADAVSVAADLATEYALLNCEAALETHGAMGFTWEFAGHRYLKRAHVLRTLV